MEKSFALTLQVTRHLSSFFFWGGNIVFSLSHCFFFTKISELVMAGLVVNVYLFYTRVASSRLVQALSGFIFFFLFSHHPRVVFDFILVAICRPI